MLSNCVSGSKRSIGRANRGYAFVVIDRAVSVEVFSSTSRRELHQRTIFQFDPDEAKGAVRFPGHVDAGRCNPVARECRGVQPWHLVLVVPATQSQNDARPYLRRVCARVEENI